MLLNAVNNNFTLLILRASQNKLPARLQSGQQEQCTRLQEQLEWVQAASGHGRLRHSGECVTF